VFVTCLNGQVKYLTDNIHLLGVSNELMSVQGQKWSLREQINRKHGRAEVVSIILNFGCRSQFLILCCHYLSKKKIGVKQMHVGT
jgi:hypothetical protein